MSKIIIEYLMLILLISCNQGNSITNEDGIEITRNKFPLSQEKILSIENARRYTENEKFKIREEDLNKRISDHLNHGYGLESHYYSFYSENLFSVYVLQEGYEAILFVCKKGDVMKFKEVAGGVCGGPVELEDGRVKWCDEKYSEFRGGKLIIIKKSITTSGFEPGAKKDIEEKKQYTTPCEGKPN